ncbi:hypothetical protein ACLOJK_012887 [Asimina triloba]
MHACSSCKDVVARSTDLLRCRGLRESGLGKRHPPFVARPCERPSKAENASTIHYGCRESGFGDIDLLLFRAFREDGWFSNGRIEGEDVLFFEPLEAELGVL